MSVTVKCDNEIVGGFIANIVVNDTIILELKTVRRIIATDKIRLKNYLVTTGKPVGLIVDFGARKVAIKRKAKDLTAD